MFKVKYIVIGLLLLLIGGGYWWWNAYGQYTSVQFVPGDPDVSSPEEYTRYYEALNRAYAKDIYGGATPEETLALFIDALKNGDVDLASKYFVVEKQEEMRKDFEIGKENNNLDFLIGFLEAVDHGTDMGNNEFRFTVIEGNAAVMSFDLVLNKQTKKWKMYEL